MSSIAWAFLGGFISGVGCIVLIVYLAGVVMNSAQHPYEPGTRHP